MKPNTGLPSDLPDCGDLDHKDELITPHLHLLIFVNCQINLYCQMQSWNHIYVVLILFPDFYGKQFSTIHEEKTTNFIIKSRNYTG
jgi:hypothetical protein